jgi:putative transposase
MKNENENRPNRHLAHLASLLDQPIVFLTVTTHERRRILDNPQVQTVLNELWERSAENNGWFVGDYILMPDHVHLFARAARESDPMAEWVKMWKSVSARRLKIPLCLTAPMWQADYFDRFLRTGESYAEKWAYVEANPVREGLVSRPEEWKHKGRIHELRF